MPSLLMIFNERIEDRGNFSNGCFKLDVKLERSKIIDARERV